jgi:hypothetical protein
MDKKQLEKRKEGIKKAKEEHLKKIKEFTGKNYTLPDYWKKEIDRMDSEIEEIDRKLND